MDGAEVQKVAVLGASGQIGARVVAQLAARGADVVALSRAAGVDAYSGHGLEEAFAGVSTVVDCLNVETMSRKRAVDFFTTTAGNVAAAADRAGVPRIVCVSIINAEVPAVQRWMGYYAGKAAQVAAYRTGPVPVTVVSSAQWYELAETLLSQASVGPFAFVPGMRSRPLAAEEAAAFLVDHVLERAGGPSTDVAIAGPEVRDMAELARAITDHRGGSGRVVRIPVSFTALGTGGLLPEGDFTVARTRFEDWLSTAPRT